MALHLYMHAYYLDVRFRRRSMSMGPFSFLPFFFYYYYFHFQSLLLFAESRVLFFFVLFDSQSSTG